MATFYIFFPQFNANTFDNLGSGGVGLGTLFNNTGPGDASVSMDPVSACIWLDPDDTGDLPAITPIGINSLPAGFTVVTAAFLMPCTSPDSGAGDTVFITLNGITPIDVTAQAEADSFINQAYSPLRTMLQMFNDGCFLDNHMSAIGAVNWNWTTGVLPSDPDFSSVLNGPVIRGTYTALSFRWTLETPTDPIEEDSVVTVTSPIDPPFLDFTQLLTATLEWTDANGNPQSIDIPQILWITFTIHLFRFTVPALTGAPPIVLLKITSTQFSGSVTLGKLLTIFFLNATGIYTLIPDKSNDTIYDNDNGGTIDVKIPNPFWKTGFIGG